MGAESGVFRSILDDALWHRPGSREGVAADDVDGVSASVKLRRVLWRRRCRSSCNDHAISILLASLGIRAVSLRSETGLLWPVVSGGWAVLSVRTPILAKRPTGMERRFCS